MMTQTQVSLGRAVALMATAMLLLTGVAKAQTTDNLQDLATSHGSLTIGDKIFSNFSYFEQGLTSFDPSKIQVTASTSNGTYYLTWDGNMNLTTSNGSGPASADLVLKYSVTATSGVIDAIDAAFTGSAQPNGGAFIAIDETARDRNGHTVGSTHLDTQHNTDTFPINPPQSQLDVTKDISFGISNGGFATVSEVAQSFHQIPEPGSIAMFISGLFMTGGMVFLRRSRR